MLLDLYKHLRFGPLRDYQYVGFGSVAFVDFRMVHRAFGIDELHSIEGTEDTEEQIRFDKNKPYERIDLRFGHSSVVLPQLNFSRHSLVWLDYDNAARRSMANDLGTVAANAKSGTFVAITFTNIFPTGKAASKKAIQNLKDGFPEFVPHDAKAIDYQGPKYAEFVRSTFSALLETALSDADAGAPDPLEKRAAFQVCYFKYSDGAPMATVGWLIVSERDLPKLELCRLEALPFYRDGEKAFTISIPKVTPLEIREMERRLPSPDTCVELSWIPLEDRQKFARLYRYLPSFAPIEPV
jgi:hypothetical protein